MNIEVSSVAGRIQNGADSVGATRQRLGVAPTTEPLKRGVTVKATTGNAGVLYVGGPEVAVVSGYALAPGESVFVAAASIEQINVIGSAAAQAYSWIAI